LTGNEEPTGISKEEKEIIEVLRGDKDMTNAVMEFAKVKKKRLVLPEVTLQLIKIWR